MKPSKRFILVTNILKDEKLREKIKQRFFSLPKEEQNADSLTNIALAQFAFKMFSVHGFPKELIYEWLEDFLNE